MIKEIDSYYSIVNIVNEIDLVNKFEEFSNNQKDAPTEYLEILNDYFWDLI